MQYSGYRCHVTARIAGINAISYPGKDSEVQQQPCCQLATPFKSLMKTQRKEGKGGSDKQEVDRLPDADRRVRCAQLAYGLRQVTLAVIQSAGNDKD